MKTPFLSIVIPIYNSEAYLKRCVDSCLFQEESEYEILLIDDGSTDHSFDICESYKSGYNNVKVFHQDNAGVSAARNLGIQHAHGSYIWFVDSDDFIANSSIKIIRAIIERDHPDLLVFNSCFTKDKLYRGEIDAFIRNYHCTYDVLYAPWNKIYRLDILKKHRVCFDRDERIAEDCLFTFATMVHYVIQFAVGLFQINYIYISIEKDPYSRSRWMMASSSKYRFIQKR